MNDEAPETIKIQGSSKGTFSNCWWRGTFNIPGGIEYVRADIAKAREQFEPSGILQRQIDAVMEAGLIVKRLTEALERLGSGEAIYVGGIIPRAFVAEHRARMKFTELVLSGVGVKDAEAQACNEQVQITKAALKGDKEQ